MSYLTEDPKWIHFYPKFSASLKLEKAGYFDERPEISTSVTSLIAMIVIPTLAFHSLFFLLLTPLVLFGWGKLYVHLPIHTGIEDCTSAAWGAVYMEDSLMVYHGGGGNFEGGPKTKLFYMPWSLQWYRTSTLLHDRSWNHETYKTRIKWTGDPDIVGGDKWLENNRRKEYYSFLDKYDNTTVAAIVGVQEREWRRRWLMWTRLFGLKRKTIEIKFNQEVGHRKGSWKGGTIGCSYEMIGNETPLECLTRMQIEREF